MNRLRRWLGAACACLGGASALAMMGCESQRVKRITLDLPSEGLVAVDVENFAGSVEVNGDWWSRDAAMVVVQRTVLNTDLELEDALERGMDFTAELVESEAGTVVVVRSTSAFADRPEHYADVTVRVPRLDGVRIINARGPVEASHFRGAIEVRNGGGSIEARTDYPLRQPSELITDEGSIFIQLPMASHVSLDAKTLNGVVQVRGENYTDTHGISNVRSVGRSQLNFDINEPEAPLVARTSKGRIYLELDLEDAGFPERWWRSEGIEKTPDWRRGGIQRNESNLPSGTQRDPRDAPGSRMIPGM